jgi:hypothetical protein
MMLIKPTLAMAFVNVREQVIEKHPSQELHGIRQKRLVLAKIDQENFSVCEELLQVDAPWAADDLAHNLITEEHLKPRNRGARLLYLHAVT